MGMNFYKIEDNQHLGKRSAGGNYCWDCEISLCMSGIFKIHDSKSEWNDGCPDCGQKPKEDNRAVMIELGFEPPRNESIEGVTSISTFTYAITRDELYEFCNINRNVKCIRDEINNDLYTGVEFMDMLYYNCPIRFTNLIGREFS